MARLSDGQVAGLIDRLTHELSVPQAAGDDGDELIRGKLVALSGTGDLGPLLAQKLASYLNRPVRCTSAAAAPVLIDRITYAARDESGVWVAIDNVLAASFADAMIGGDGDPARVGLGHKASRVATGAAAQMIAALSLAAGLTEPSEIEDDPAALTLGTPLGGGSLSLDSGEHAWLFGKRVSLRESLPQSRVSPNRVSLAGALEEARAALARGLRTRVAFGPAQRERQIRPSIPPGWIRMGLPASAGIAVVAIDEQTASVMLAALAGGGLPPELGALARSGAETIATDALHAFLGALEGTTEQTRHAVRLTDAAILAATPHEAIEHEINIDGRSGKFRWLAPTDLVASGT